MHKKDSNKYILSIIIIVVVVIIIIIIIIIILCLEWLQLLVFVMSQIPEIGQR